LNVCKADQVLGFAVLRERVVAVPPIWKPRVPDDEREEPTARVDVATDCKAPDPTPYSN
jgi:hypothetical protein